MPTVAQIATAMHRRKARQSALQLRRRRPAPDAERHYLPFPGATTHFAYADAVFGATPGDYTIAVKVHEPINSGGTGAYMSTGGPGADAGGRSCYDVVLRLNGGTASYFNGLVPDTAVNNYLDGSWAAASAGPKVFAIKRTLAGGAGGAKMRVIDNSGVEETSDAAATMYRPDHFAIAGRIDNALTFHTQAGAPKFISALIASVQVPDAELVAWLTGVDAEDHVAGILGYWCASDLVGTAIPARVGSVDMTVVGLTDADLVSL